MVFIYILSNWNFQVVSIRSRIINEDDLLSHIVICIVFRLFFKSLRAVLEWERAHTELPGREHPISHYFLRVPGNMTVLFIAFTICLVVFVVATVIVTLNRLLVMSWWFLTMLQDRECTRVLLRHITDLLEGRRLAAFMVYVKLDASVCCSCCGLSRKVLI